MRTSIFPFLYIILANIFVTFMNSMNKDVVRVEEASSLIIKKISTQFQFWQQTYLHWNLHLNNINHKTHTKKMCLVHITHDLKRWLNETRKFIITINEMSEFIVSNGEENVDENKNEVIDFGPVFVWIINKMLIMNLNK